METVAIKTGNRIDFKRLLGFFKPIDISLKRASKKSGDKYFISLIEEAMKEPSVSRDEVMKALRQ